MTTPRMTDERLAEGREFARYLHCKGHIAAASYIDEIIREVTRTRTVSDEVRAAMERYRKHLAAMERRSLSESPYAVLLQQTSWVLTESEIERDLELLANAFIKLVGQQPGKGE